ncbi:hypothetical protein DM02DRAFT_730156 [Periconia macrospinosa]|uniref:Uncharacterized protein n=1 Tax=Periconia macrospinosa TaxID=97972 RepID=A0A2V1DL67_9PLEO|nr:hypothetical protein DM02DRAFT_730156 [Periconia macrospinosa]
MQGNLEVVEATEAREPEAATTDDMNIDESEEPHHIQTPPSNTTPPPQQREPYPYPPFTISDLKTNPKEPLYTEINIPLPPLRKRGPTSYSTLRNRAHSLHSSFKPFHRRGSSSDSSALAKESVAPRPPPPPSHEAPAVVKSRETAAAMNLRKGHRRSRTVDALAVVPAVLVLRAELFTPVREEEEVRDGILGRVSDRIVGERERVARIEDEREVGVDLVSATVLERMGVMCGFGASGPESKHFKIDIQGTPEMSWTWGNTVCSDFS